MLRGECLAKHPHPSPGIPVHRLPSSLFPMTRIQAIFFDAVGTLFDVKGSVGHIYAQAALGYGVRMDPQPLNRAFYRVFQSAKPMAFPNPNPATLDQEERRWWQQIVEATLTEMGIDLSAASEGDSSGFPNFSNYFREVYDLFATADPWQLYPETIEVLQHLRSQGIPLGVISNFDSRLLPVLQRLGLRDFFSHVIISTQVGSAKPEQQVFEKALQAFQIQPEAALHVGDSHSQDYQGAKQAGLQALWLQRDPQPEQPFSPETIRDLAGILRLL
ncbi:MAG: HAD-IA family hydrolase [Cyanobacteriota bacterium]|nr:HAD-IA family hydrolase [Cyanobacteriota bacterium]